MAHGLYPIIVLANCYILFLDHTKALNTSNTPIKNYILKKNSRQEHSSVMSIRPTLVINFQDK